MRCWCGDEQLEAFSSDYLRCAKCETLVVARMPFPEELIVTDDENDFYGRQYHESYVIAKYGHPTLEDRSRADLPERCAHWLRTLLRYKLPPSKVLELGSAHGGFVALMRWAGFDATGLELSPWLAGYARKTFDVPMLEGVLENQHIEPRSLDAVVLMDVLEHLYDPKGTMLRCLQLLKPGGVLLIQTPCYTEDKGFAEMQSEDSPFLQLLTPDQHLYLFSKSSIRRLFAELGTEHLQFEPAIFAHYDMFFAVGTGPLATFLEEDGLDELGAKSSGRLVRAVLDLHSQHQVLLRRCKQFEEDRTTHLQVIENLEKRLTESEHDRADRLENMKKLESWLTESRSALEARHEVSLLQEQLLSEMQKFRDDLATQNIDLRDRLAEGERRLLAMQKLRDDLTTQNIDLSDRLADGDRRLQETMQSSRGMEAESKARLAELKEQNAASQIELQTCRNRLAQAETAAETMATSYRTLEANLQAAIHGMNVVLIAPQEGQSIVSSGWVSDLFDDSPAVATESGDKFKGLMAKIQELQKVAAGRLQQEEEARQFECAFAKAREEQLEERCRNLERRLDGALTILERLPNTLVVRLLRIFGLWTWVQPVTAKAQPVAELPAPVVESSRKLKRVCVDLTPVLPGGDNGGAKILCLALIEEMGIQEPECEFILLTSAKSHDELANLETRNIQRVCVDGLEQQTGLEFRDKNSVVSDLNADLLFCPFTAPFFFDARVPTVSLVLDVQYLRYPEFFTPGERAERDRNFRQACKLASRIVCISEFVRQTVLQAASVSSARVETVHISVQDRFSGLKTDQAETVLRRWGLLAGRYLLYPANFWQHKNHELLITAFGVYHKCNPGSDLKLVCTGAPSPRMEYLQDACRVMGLGEKVVFTGFLPDHEFGVMLRSCLAVIFPSLYEGFGIPVWEAMAAGKPVLCSNITSLPEICGDAAVLFDPRKPDEIVAAIERIDSDPQLLSELIEKGNHLVASAPSQTDMATRYLKIFREALQDPKETGPGIYGLTEDRWTSDQAVITFPSSDSDRTLKLELVAAEWIPVDSLVVHLTSGTNGGRSSHQIVPGRTLSIRKTLPREAGSIQLLCDNTFQPSSYVASNDTRKLGCRVESAQIIGMNRTFNLLEAADVN